MAGSRGLFLAGIRRQLRSALEGALDLLAPERGHAPPLAHTDTGRLLWHPPPPLIDPRNKLLVIFSAKAACSNVLVWFLHHLGHAAAARDFHRAPHQYRTQVYYRSALYHRAYRDNLQRYRVVRVIRDPYDRAVSAFRHLLRHAHGPFGQYMKMDHITRQGLSFSQYLDFLERLDLKTCDPHFAVQRHPLEDVVTVKYLINVSTDDLYARLGAIEAELGLEHTDLKSSDWVSHIDRRNRRQGTPLSGDAYTTPMLPDQARRGPWPGYADFLTAQACSRLTRLYAVDIESYGIRKR